LNCYIVDARRELLDSKWEFHFSSTFNNKRRKIFYSPTDILVSCFNGSDQTLKKKKKTNYTKEKKNAFEFKSN